MQVDVSGQAEVGMDVALIGVRLRSATHRCQPRNDTPHSLTMPTPQGGDMTWTTPAYTELRLGFEITMYIANR